MTQAADGRPVTALALRSLLAGLAVAAYLAARPRLDGGALVAARFGLGLLLFTLLLDVGRSVAGSGPAVRGRLAPHTQRTRPQVDETYDRLRAALDRYLAEGVAGGALVDAIRGAASARETDGPDPGELVERVREAGNPEPTSHRPLGVRLLAGLVLTAGLTLAVASLAEVLGLAVIPPVLLVAGVSLATLQWRAQAAGARWTGLALGLLGATVFGLGSVRILLAQPALGLALGLATLLIAVGTVVATVRTDPEPDPWPEVRADLESHTTGLRRAFLVALLAGVVVFPLDPLVTGLLDAAGLPGDLGLRLALIGFVTITGFLTLEMAGTWLALTRGRRRAGRIRTRRREAVDAVLDDLEPDDEPAPGARGRSP